MVQPAPPLSVAINAVHAKTGGGVTHLKNLLPRLAQDRRLTVTLILTADQVAQFHPLPDGVRLALAPVGAGLARLMIWEQLCLPAFVRSLGAQVTLCMANYGSWLLRRQVVVLCNTLDVVKWEPRFSKKLYWWALGLLTLGSVLVSRGIIAISDYAAHALTLGLHPWLKGKISVVHHGVAPVFAPGSAPRGDFLLAVSDFYVQKNLPTLLQALARLKASHPMMRLVVAGAAVDGPYRDRVMALADDLGLSDQIDWVGRQDADQLAHLYRTCRVFVFPSTAEAFGMPLVEAMACGAPCVSSDRTAMPEVAGDGALLVDPTDPAALAQAVAQIWDQPDLAAHLSARALARARSFSWDRAACQTADALVSAATS